MNTNSTLCRVAKPIIPIPPEFHSGLITFNPPVGGLFSKREFCRTPQALPHSRQSRIHKVLLDRYLKIRGLNRFIFLGCPLIPPSAGSGNTNGELFILQALKKCSLKVIFSKFPCPNSLPFIGEGLGMGQLIPSAFINSSKPDSGIMPMNRNVQSNRVCEDWTVIFLQSV